MRAKQVAVRGFGPTTATACGFQWYGHHPSRGFTPGGHIGEPEIRWPDQPPVSLTTRVVDASGYTKVKKIW